MKEKTTKVCPICGSAKLYYEVGGKIGFVYHCKNCDYIGSFIVEANEEMVQALKNLFLERKALTKEKNKSKTNGDEIND
jgi:RNA polymerase subunit RPABC4/transcription elongation factor Spt4